MNHDLASSYSTELTDLERTINYVRPHIQDLVLEYIKFDSDF